MIPNISSKHSDPAQISWKIHPLRDNLKKAVLFWAILVFVIFMVYWNLELDFSQRTSIFVTFFVTLILLLYFSQFYLPTRYHIDAQGLEERRFGTHRKFEWKRVKRIVQDRRGLFISPFPTKSRLENFRGLMLFYHQNEDQVKSVVKQYKPELFPQESGLSSEPGTEQ